MLDVKGTYDDLYDAILGKEFTTQKKYKQPVVCKEEVAKKLYDLTMSDTIYAKLFRSSPSGMFFEKTCPDLYRVLDCKRDELVEAFYALKLGEYYKEVSPRVQYYLKQAYDEAHEIPNLIFKFLPHKLMAEMFTEGFFPEGITAREVIQTMFNPEYKPVCSTNPINRMTDFSEIYVKDTDMVVAVPNNIANKIPVSNIADITVDALGVQIHGMYLRTMGNTIGYAQSIYDLRNVI